nr:MAG TPA: hypothetical protein [Caudoviricetes sp.]
MTKVFTTGCPTCYCNLRNIYYKGLWVKIISPISPSSTDLHLLIDIYENPCYS